jgi:hypothetical protein
MTSRAEKARGANTRVVVVAMAALVLILVAAGVFWDLWNRRQRPIDCGDGQRYAIDARQFDTRYFTYSLELEASVKGSDKILVKLDPVQLQKLSEGMESANEFRKYVVAGFNSCAVTKVEYGQWGARFQALDNLAREINELATKPSRSTQESATLTTLVNEFADQARKLGTN